MMESMQSGIVSFFYKGVMLIKSPFDLALYMKMFQEVRPRSIIEIGSAFGGSAIWFGDMLNNFSIDGHVYSYDIKVPQGVFHPRASFHYGDARKPVETFSKEFLDSLPRPLLVIEDSDHQYETVKGVLNHFQPIMKHGEYIVVEDGNAEILYGDQYNGGPSKAIKEFLSLNPDYQVDDIYCDFFGINTTWSPNGFLTRK